MALPRLEGITDKTVSPLGGGGSFGSTGTSGPLGSSGGTTMVPGDTLLDDPPHAVSVDRMHTALNACKNCFINELEDMFNPYGSIENGQGPEVPLTAAILVRQNDSCVTAGLRNDDNFRELRSENRDQVGRNFRAAGALPGSARTPLRIVCM